ANLSDCSIKTPSGPSRTTPAPLPLKLDEPSTDRVHGRGSLLFGGLVSSRTKSANTWDLIDPLGT
ncbi:hypothetical protein A2U01_0103230, partial [Trifolium medium]|nr:hypothetical protein [Trifolium medium]